jgi:hypothetical protein
VLESKKDKLCCQAEMMNDRLCLRESKNNIKPITTKIKNDEKSHNNRFKGSHEVVIISTLSLRFKLIGKVLLMHNKTSCKMFASAASFGNILVR